MQMELLDERLADMIRFVERCPTSVEIDTKVNVYMGDVEKKIMQILFGYEEKWKELLSTKVAYSEMKEKIKEKVSKIEYTELLKKYSLLVSNLDPLLSN